MRWHDARAAVNPPCVTVLKNWMGEDNTIELEETFQEWIDLRDDDEDEDDSSSMEGVSDTEPSRRTSSNAIPTVHEAAGPSHSRVSAREARADSRIVRHRQDPEQVLPSIESPTRHAPNHGRKYSPPQPLYYGAPPPPAPSPPQYRAPVVANYGRQAAPPAASYSHRVDTNMFGHPAEQTRTLARDRQAPLIDLTSSPAFSRTNDQALPRMVHVGPLRGGDSNRQGDFSNPPAESTGRYTTRSQAARNRGDGMVPYVASRPAPPSVARQEPPHPAVPRTGWVTYPAFNRQGEAVR